VHWSGHFQCDGDFTVVWVNTLIGIKVLVCLVGNTNSIYCTKTTIAEPCFSGGDFGFCHPSFARSNTFIIDSNFVVVLIDQFNGGISGLTSNLYNIETI
jgi:hypothetical protein